MKTLTFVTALLLALPLGSALADDAKEKPAKAAEECKAKAEFVYTVDMMNIEREEIDNKISHEKASHRKLKRHEKLVDELEDCADLKDE